MFNLKLQVTFWEHASSYILFNSCLMDQEVISHIGLFAFFSHSVTKKYLKSFIGSAPDQKKASETQIFLAPSALGSNLQKTCSRAAPSIPKTAEQKYRQHGTVAWLKPLWEGGTSALPAGELTSVQINGRTIAGVHPVWVLEGTDTKISQIRCRVLTRP